MVYFQYTSPRRISFYGESTEDLNLMPTTTKIGEGDYVHALAPEGSYAMILTTEGLKLYMLRSTGWIEVTNSGGGGSPSGTVDWNTQVINRPTINGNQLEGDMTSEDIGVAPIPRVENENLIIG